jgi:transcriptional regulator with XRE-family HTH domain
VVLFVIDEIHSTIVLRIRQLGITKTEVARRARISRETLYRLLRGEVTDPSLSVLSALARAIEIPVANLLSTKYRAILDERESGGQKEELTGSFCKLAYCDITQPADLFAECNKPMVRRIEFSNRSLVRTCEGEFVSSSAAPEGTFGVTSPPLIRLHPVSERIAVPSLLPNQSAVVDIEFVAPCQPCTVIALLIWRGLQAPNGQSAACSCANKAAMSPLFICFSVTPPPPPAYAQTQRNAVISCGGA